MIETITFGSEAHQYLTLYCPDQASFPMAVFVHGGSWKDEDPMRADRAGRYLMGYGIGCATLNYRLYPEYLFPCPAWDVAWAIRWVLDNAFRYGARLDHLTAIGHSAGGHLVSLLALDPTYGAAKSLTKVVSLSGVYDLRSLPQFLLGPFSQADKWEASPLAHVGPGAASFYLTHGLPDLPQLPRQARAFRAALEKAGRKVCLDRILGIHRATSDLDRYGSPLLEFILS